MKLVKVSSPHIKSRSNTNRVMGNVILALLPALLVGVRFMGLRALVVTAASIVTAVAAEFLCCVIAKKPNTIHDGSAVVTGLLLAMTLPATVPYWLVVAGSAFAIIFVKVLCGGLGQNVFNPALAARAMMMLVYPMGVVRFFEPGVDGVSSSTPLHYMVIPQLPSQSLLDMFLGKCPGCIGEVSAAALILGGIYLVCRRVIDLRIPLAYLGTVALITLIFPRTGNPLQWMLYSLLSGGVMLGAIFMATDYATSPTTAIGQILYGVGCGVLTVVFRYFSLFPEGVTYAILMMNAVVWLLDRYTAPRRFGTKRGGAK